MFHLCVITTSNIMNPKHGENSSFSEIFTTKADLFHNKEQKKKPIMSQYRKSTIHNEVRER